MKAKTRPVSSCKSKKVASKPKQVRLTPERLRSNKEAARRAEKIMALYFKLALDEAEYLMGDLLADLMHLCDFDPRWGEFHVRQQ